MKRTRSAINKFGQVIESHPRITSTVVFLLVGLVAAYVFYLRFPNNFAEANFYAEDGRDFAANIINKGFLGALFTTFNGYFIWGLYAVEGTGFVLNLLAGGSLISLPQAVALSSYLFLGFTAALPVLLFRRQLGWTYLMILVAATVLVPLPSSDYAIIGTIGNLKWAFTYIAFLLVIYRMQHSNSPWRKLALADVALVVCAYSNATTYLLLPFLLIPYMVMWLREKIPMRAILKMPSFLGLVGVGVALIPQVVVAAVMGIPKLPGYLDTPFKPERAIEVFVGRSYLYGLLFPVYKHLTDALAIGLVVLTGCLMFAYGGKANRLIYATGFFAIFSATALFALNRPGVTDYLANYGTSGPDQFFYAQNLIMYFLVIYALSVAGKRLSPSLRWFPPCLACLVLIMALPKTGSWGANNFMADSVGTFADNAVEACRAQHGSKVAIQLYPVKSSAWKMPLAAQSICPDASQLPVTRERLNLAPDKNNHKAILKAGVFTQTFKSSENNLDGLNVFLSTYGAKTISRYRLTVYDQSCSKPLRSADIPTTQLPDNALKLVKFNTIAESKDKPMCFSISPAGDVVAPLAIQLSKPDVYPAGTLTLEGQEKREDVVFELHHAAKP